MTALNDTKKKRFKIATYTVAFLALVTMYAVYAGMETVAVTSIGGIMSITMVFIGGDSYRKSEPE